LLDLSLSTFYIILYHMTLYFPSYTTFYMVRLPDAFSIHDHPPASASAGG
jgi:hypothetical protein